MQSLKWAQQERALGNNEKTAPINFFLFKGNYLALKIQISSFKKTLITTFPVDLWLVCFVIHRIDRTFLE